MFADATLNPWSKSEETKKKISEAKKGIRNSQAHNVAIARGRSKPVVQLTKDGEEIKIYPSALLAKEDGFNPAHIISCCRGNRKYHLGYRWEYVNKDEPTAINEKVDCWLNIMNTGEIIATEYECLFDAMQSFKISYDTYNKIKQHNNLSTRDRVKWKIVIR